MSPELADSVAKVLEGRSKHRCSEYAPNTIPRGTKIGNEIPGIQVDGVEILSDYGRSRVETRAERLLQQNRHEAGKFAGAAIQSAAGGPSDTLSWCRRCEKLTPSGLCLARIVLKEFLTLLGQPRLA